MFVPFLRRSSVARVEAPEEAAADGEEGGAAGGPAAAAAAAAKAKAPAGAAVHEPASVEIEEEAAEEAETAAAKKLMRAIPKQWVPLPPPGCLTVRLLRCSALAIPPSFGRPAPFATLLLGGRSHNSAPSFGVNPAFGSEVFEFPDVDPMAGVTRRLHVVMSAGKHKSGAGSAVTEVKGAIDAALDAASGGGGVAGGSVRAVRGRQPPFSSHFASPTTAPGATSVAGRSGVLRGSAAACLRAPAAAAASNPLSHPLSSPPLSRPFSFPPHQASGLHGRTGGLLGCKLSRAEQPEFAEDGLPFEFPEEFCGRCVVSVDEASERVSAAQPQPRITLLSVTIACCCDYSCTCALAPC